MRNHFRNSISSPDEGSRGHQPKRWDSNKQDEDTYRSNIINLHNSISHKYRTETFK